MKNDDGRIADEPVCLGPHKATRQLRDSWLAQERIRGVRSKKKAHVHIAENADGIYNSKR